MAPPEKIATSAYDNIPAAVLPRTRAIDTNTPAAAPKQMMFTNDLRCFPLVVVVDITNSNTYGIT